MIDCFVTLDELAFMVWLKGQGYMLPKPLIGRSGWWAAIIPLFRHYSIQGGRIGDRASIEIRYCCTHGLFEAFEVRSW